jgi:hypothetical protein
MSACTMRLGIVSKNICVICGLKRSEANEKSRSDYQAI